MMINVNARHGIRSSHFHVSQEVGWVLHMPDNILCGIPMVSNYDHQSRSIPLAFPSLLMQIVLLWHSSCLDDCHISFDFLNESGSATKWTDDRSSDKICNYIFLPLYCSFPWAYITSSSCHPNQSCIDDLCMHTLCYLSWDMLEKHQ